jgi:hypothetical protein
MAVIICGWYQVHTEADYCVLLAGLIPGQPPAKSGKLYSAVFLRRLPEQSGWICFLAVEPWALRL